MLFNAVTFENYMVYIAVQIELAPFWFSTGPASNSVNALLVLNW